jgi:hypothetical protein
MRDEHPTPIFLADGGEEFRGAYSTSSGLVHVHSDYGSASARIGRAEPLQLAERLFAEVLDAWCGK